MICKPNIWSDDKYGGYLENTNKEISLITGSTHHDHKTENKNNLYKTINYLNSIKFSVNKLLFDYLQFEGNYLLNEIKSSNELQKFITLKIAEIYKNIPFYLTVNSDWRGRIYTQSFFLTYQGGDLSSSLINFHADETNSFDILNESGKYHLYIHGANNHNFNNISKDSYFNRIKWVQDNYNKIISLDKDLILSAEKPFTFLSFCLNIKELDKNPNHKINIPIFLDATCSGIQHLSALLQDLELGSSVNLTDKLSEIDKPNDIYTNLIVPINKSINKFGEENSEYSTLSLIKLNRKLV